MTGSALLLSSVAQGSLRDVNKARRANLVQEIRDLMDGSADPAAQFVFGREDKKLTAALLPHSGYTVVYRELTSDELARQGRRSNRRGYIIVDILTPDSAVFFPHNER